MDGCKECRVLREMEWGEQTGNDMERQETPHPELYDPLHIPHLSASHFPYIYSSLLLMLG